MGNLRIELKWGFIFFLMTLVWMVIEKLVGLHDVHIEKHPIFTMFFLIPAVAMYVLALLDKRKNFYYGEMNYLQGLKTGVMMTLIITILAPVGQYIISTYITPDYFKNVINYVDEHNMMARKEAEKMFNLNTYLWQSAIGSLVIGLVTSAVVAIFTVKKAKIEN